METEGDFWLLITFMLNCLLPEGPYPVGVLAGPQGAGKTLTSRAIRLLVDPSVALVRAAPREERDLVVAGFNSWLLNFDNMSGIPNWLSDAFCRFSSGSGFGTRQLHTDFEEMIFAEARALLLNGITDQVDRADLADRSVQFYLRPISEDEREEESAFWARFNEAYPFLLGSLFTLLSGALKALPEVKLTRHPRMASFARLGAAVEMAVGLERGLFEQAYEANRQQASASAIEADLLAQPLIDFVKEEGHWRGRPGELLERVESRVEEAVRKRRGWPGTPARLGGHIRRIQPLLQRFGVGFEEKREGTERTRHYSLWDVYGGNT